MATQIFSRTLLNKPTAIFSLLSRSFTSLPRTPTTPLVVYRSFFRSLRPLAAASHFSFSTPSRSFSTRSTTSSLNDPSPNWSNRPPKETILLDGCDFNHWLVVMEQPEGDPTRDDIIDSYIKTLAQVVGSEDEARMKIYSVSTKCYFAFGALVSEELSYKIKELPRVRWVLPDSYLDVKNKDYGGEPFIDGKAVPYDPKYHEEWIRNNARANERNRRNDRPRNFDRSRNYERRRENMQNQDFQNTRAPPMRNQGMQNPPSNMAGMPQNNMSGPGGPPPPPNNYMGGQAPPPPNNYVSGQQPPQPNNYMGRPPPPPPPPNNYMGRTQDMRGMPQNIGSPPPNNMGEMPSNMGGTPPNAGWSNNMPGNMQQNYQNRPDNSGVPPQGPPSNMGGMPPNAGWSNNMPGNMQQNYQNRPDNSGVPPQGPPSNYQNYS